MKHCECLRRHEPANPNLPSGFYAVTVAPLVVELHRQTCGMPWIEKVLREAGWGTTDA